MSIEDYDVCRCGHLQIDHHRSWFRNGYQLVEECEYYGWNEHGGSMPSIDGSGKWEDHCQKFKKANPEEEKEFLNCDLEELLAELDFAEPGTKQRIMELAEILRTRWAEPEDVDPF